SLAEVANAAEALDAQLFPPARPARRVPESEPRKRSPAFAVGMIVAFIAAAAVVGVLLERRAAQSAPAGLGAMVMVPAGSFLSSGGQQKNLAAFYIDEYEVTLRQ